MEEIDIIELLKRVKEGKAPKEIEINDVAYERNTDGLFCDCIDLMYCRNIATDKPTNWWIDDKMVTLDTKIKILDKPIIEELKIKDEGSKYIPPDTFEMSVKINEIIKWINKECNNEI